MHIADRTVDGLRPYSWYKHFLVEGARAHRLAEDYISTLEAIEAGKIPIASAIEEDGRSTAARHDR